MEMRRGERGTDANRVDVKMTMKWKWCGEKRSGNGESLLGKAYQLVISDRSERGKMRMFLRRPK